MISAKKRSVSLLIAIAAFIASAFLCVFCLNWTSARADESTSSATETNFFTMDDGAYVKAVENSTGIRFSAKIGEEFYNGLGENAKLYTKINKAGAPDSQAIVMEHENVTFTDGVAVLNAAITYNNLTEEKLKIAVGVELFAETYAEKSDSTTVFATNKDTVDNTRSMRAIANSALINDAFEDETEKNLIKQYVGTQTKIDGNHKRTNAVLVEDGATKVTVGTKTGTAYLGSKKIGEATNGVVTVPEPFTTSTDTYGRVNDKDYLISIFDENNNVDYATVKCVTKILKTAEDLKFFDYEGDTTVWDGYYILDNDIDASEYTHKHSAKNISADVWAAYKFGLLGTFDGNGHVIDGITVGHGGLFMMIATSATVKDVALTNVRFAAENRTGTLAAYISDFNAIEPNVSISDVYVSTSNYPEGDQSGVLAFSIQTGSVAMKNVVVEASSVSGKNGSFVYREARPDATTSYSNIYVVSPTPLSYYANVTGGPAYRVMDAGNVDTQCTIYRNFKRYDDYPAMKAAGNTYTGFDSAIWDLTTYGVPCFKGVTIDVNKFVATERYMLDATDGVLYSEETGNVVTIDGIFRSENVVLTSVSDELTSDLTVDGNKIKGYTVSGTETPAARNVILTEEGGTYISATVTPYTRVIDSAEDLAFFNWTSVDEYFDGYYVLAKNIDASGYTHTHGISEASINNYVGVWQALNRGLSGTFDGRGYTIDGITFGNYGLFGMISYTGTAKNLGLTNVKYGTAKWTSALAYVVSFSSEEGKNPNSIKPKVENIYLQSDELPTGENSGALLVKISNNVIMNNVIVDISETVTTGASFVGKHDYASDVGPSTGFATVFVISKCALGQDKDGNIADAGTLNGVEQTGTGTGTLYKSAKRYETAAQMKAANNSYATFSSAYWTVTTGEIPVWKTATANTSNT